MNNSLTAIANKYKTDKGSLISFNKTIPHNYCEYYDKYFRDGRENVCKVLEIGIYKASSLKMWREYFPRAKIYGIDKNPTQINNSNIITYQCNQNDKLGLDEFIKLHGSNFDIIIDDGSHRVNHQQFTFGQMFKHVNKGGYYVIEDLHTSRKSYHEKYHTHDFGVNDTESNNTLNMIFNYIASGHIKSEYIDQENLMYLDRNIDTCSLISKNNSESITCIIKKL